MHIANAERPITFSSLKMMMNNTYISHLKKYIHWYLLGFMFLGSWVLALHNIPLYHYKHGFDGGGHVDYLNYIVLERKLPPANYGWETHQSPLYYFIGSFLMSIFGTWKAAQYINIVILWVLIGVSYIGLRKVFKKKDQAIVGILSLAALPMLNIFPVMVTNELMNAMWSIATLVSLIFLLKSSGEREYLKYSSLVTLFFILGFWTKVSIIMIAPMIAGVYLFKFIKSDVSRMRQIIVGVTMIITVFVACYPVFARASSSQGPSNLTMVASGPSASHPADFYLRLDWIPKLDMYNTQYYSMLGGAYNSFFNDGHNVLTPFIAFHKKAFVLWILGFFLFPLSLFGTLRLIKKDKLYGIFAGGLGLLMFGVFVYYVSRSGHYSAVRLTYETPIAFAYAVGLASAWRIDRLRYLIYGLLFIQFTVMVSFYWILPWWNVTKGY